MNEQSTPAAIHMIVTIVDRGKADKVASLCKEMQAPIHLVSLGHGTARTEMLDLLGLGETKKDIVISLIPEYRVCSLLEHLAVHMKMRYPGKGISFAVPLNSLSGRMYRGLNEYASASTERNDWIMDCTGKYEVVVTLINRGYTDLVMEAARSMGAPGGTVLNTRGIGSEESAQFLGISIQAEKELVFMVVPTEKRQEIMQAINRDAGPKSPAKGVVLSLPVSHAIGLA